MFEQAECKRLMKKTMRVNRGVILFGLAFHSILETQEKEGQMLKKEVVEPMIHADQNA